MPLNQKLLKGVMYASGTMSDITAASGSYVIGRMYIATDSSPIKIGQAVSSTVINWMISELEFDTTVTEIYSALQLASDTAQANLDAVESQLSAAITAEVSRATARENQIETGYQTAVSNLQTSLSNTIDALDTELTNAIAAESTARIAADTALNTSISTVNTRVTQEIADRIAADANVLEQAIAAAKMNVRKAFFVDLLVDADLTLAEVIGAPVSSLEDGAYQIFVSGAANTTGAITGLVDLAGQPLTGIVSNGDIYYFNVASGVVTDGVLSDDKNQLKFDALDVTVQELQDASSAQAIRSHLSAIKGVAYNAGTGVFEGVVNSSPSNDLTVDASGFFVDVDKTSSLAGGLTKTIQDHLDGLYTEIAAGAFEASNGLTKVGNDVELGGTLAKDTTVDGAFKLTLATSEVSVDSTFKLPIWGQNPDGTKGSKTTQFVELWFDANGINYVFPN